MKFIKLLTAIVFSLFLAASAVSAATYTLTTHSYYNGAALSNIRAVTYTCTNNGCYNLGSQVSDSNSGSSNLNIVTYAAPSSNGHGYATYWMVPGYRAKLTAFNPTSGGSSDQNLNFVKYQGCTAGINFVSSANSVNEGSQLTVVANIQSAISKTSGAPYAIPSDTNMVRDYFSAQTNVNITIRNSTNDVVYADTTQDYVLYDSSRNFTFQWTPDYTQAGAYTITIATSVPDSKCSDQVSQASTPKALTVTDLNGPPVLASIGSKSGMEGQLLQFTISATDPDGDNLTYSASGLPAGATFNSSTRAFSWTPNETQAGTYQVNFSVSDGSLSDSEVVTITILNASDAPKYSNLVNNPASPATYAPGQNYTFNATWTNGSAPVSSVWIVFNGATYSPSKSGNVYSLSLSNLKAGNYSYQWFANDSEGDINSTSLLAYTVNKAAPGMSITVLPSTSVVNGTQTNATASGCPAQLSCMFYRDGVNITSPDVQTFPVGSYVYVYNATGNENYTSLSVSKTLTVSTEGGEDDEDDESDDIIIIDDDDFKNGEYVYLDLGEKVKFTFCGSPYYIKFADINVDDDQLDDSSATFTLTPGSIDFTLEKGEKKELDLNEDGIKDVQFKLSDFSSETRVKVYIKRISDKCAAPIERETLEVYGEPAEALEAKSALSTWTYMMIIFMIGILLALLAILLLLLSRMNKQKAPINNPNNGFR